MPDDHKGGDRWFRNPKFLEETARLPDLNDEDPLDPVKLKEVEGVAEVSEVDTGLGRTADPTSAQSASAEFSRNSRVAKPVYEGLSGVTDPTKVCATCKHFRHDYGQQIVNDPQFIRFMAEEAKFLPGGTDPEEGPVKFHWFDQDKMGRCMQKDSTVTSKVSTCNAWKRGSALTYLMAKARGRV